MSSRVLIRGPSSRPRDTQEKGALFKGLEVMSQSTRVRGEADPALSLSRIRGTKPPSAVGAVADAERARRASLPFPPSCFVSAFSCFVH